jgi:putative two-component system hydrogenase maturation factor HypX/HoxX
MHMDMVQNRKGFAEKCSNFVYKRKTCCTPERLIEAWAKPQDIALVG